MATTRSKIVAELIGTAGTIDNAKLTGSISADKLAPGAGGTDWAHTDRIQSSDFNAVSNKGYYVNTSAALVTVTLPSTPSNGDIVSLVDVTATADTNKILINPNGNKLNGAAFDLEITSERSGLQLTYSGSTYGWIATETANETSTQILLVTNPIITSFANSVGEQYFQADGNTITITGRNFKSSPAATVTFTSDDGNTYAGANVNVASDTSITVDIPSPMTADTNTDDDQDPFTITVTNSSPTKASLAATGLEWLPTPTFGGASTTLGHIYRGEAVDTTNLSGGNITITASSLDSDDVVAIATTPTTGSLPPGMTVSVSGSSEGVDTATLGGTITSSNTASGKENITFKLTATSTSGAESLTQDSSTYTVELRSTKVTSATAATPSIFVGASGSSFTIAGIGFNGSTYPVKSASNGGVKFVNTATSFTQNADSITINSDQQMTVTTSADITAAQAGSGLDVVVELTNGDIFKLSDESSSLITAPAGITAGTPTTLTTIPSARGSYSVTIPAGTDNSGVAPTLSAGTITPSGSNLTFNAGTRVLSGTIPANFEVNGGTLTVPITLTDNVGNTLLQNYTATIETQGFSYPLGISHSALFDGSSYLTGLGGGQTGNSTTFTFSAWLKRSELSSSSSYRIFSAAPQGSVKEDEVIFTGDRIYFGSYQNPAGQGYGWQLRTNQLFRDTSDWYHLVAVLDTQNSAAVDRQRLYINGQRISAPSGFLTGSSYNEASSTSIESSINTNITHYIGRYWNSTASSLDYFKGYMANIDFIDGQALNADYFGKTQDGVWVAKAFNGQDNASGSATNDYGTNGFKLTFADSGDLGKDTAPLTTGSGNKHTAANNWTNN